MADSSSHMLRSVRLPHELGVHQGRQHSAARRTTAVAVLLATLALLSPVGPASAAERSASDVADADTFISDTERFPGWKGTLPGVKYATDAVTSGDPNHARRMAHGSLGEVWHARWCNSK
jgi:hypothetical protein